MAEQSAIGWTDGTFNPWWGCVEVSPACDNCYAREWDARFGGDHWGKNGRVHVASAQVGRRGKRVTRVVSCWFDAHETNRLTRGRHG